MNRCFQAGRLARAGAILGLLAASFGIHAEVSAVDDEGRRLRLSAPAKRIVSLSPHGTEMLFAIGAGERIVGAVEFSDYPPEALRIPRVGGYKSADMERVRALAPDLIVTWSSGNNGRQIEAMRALGLPVFVTEPRTIPEITSNMERLGELTGTRATARPAATALAERYRRLQTTYANKPAVRMFYQVWERPLLTINGKHAISDAMRTCGATNVFADLPALVPTVDVEAVMAANPEMIATSGHRGQRLEWLDAWRKWTGMAAVARNNLMLLPPDLLNRMGPRMVEGTEKLCEAVDAVRSKRTGN